jgi:hypothetical protein
MFHQTPGRGLPWSLDERWSLRGHAPDELATAVAPRHGGVCARGHHSYVHGFGFLPTSLAATLTGTARAGASGEQHKAVLAGHVRQFRKLIPRAGVAANSAGYRPDLQQPERIAGAVRADPGGW